VQSDNPPADDGATTPKPRKTGRRGPRLGFGNTKGGKTRDGKPDKRKSAKHDRSKNGRDLKDERIRHLITLLSTNQYMSTVTPYELEKDWGVKATYIEHLAGDAARIMRFSLLNNDLVFAQVAAGLQFIQAAATHEGKYGEAIKAMLARVAIVERAKTVRGAVGSDETEQADPDAERDLAIAAILPARAAAEANERGDSPPPDGVIEGEIEPEPPKT
jgi:hypothetical protein